MVQKREQKTYSMNYDTYNIYFSFKVINTSYDNKCVVQWAVLVQKYVLREKFLRRKHIPG